MSRALGRFSPFWAGAAAIVISLLIFSFIMTIFDLPQAVVSLMSGLSLCAGCFTAAYVWGRRRRHGGFFCGLVSAAAVYLAVFLIGIVVSGAVLGGGIFSRLLMLAACGCIGGICGVNCGNFRRR